MKRSTTLALLFACGGGPDLRSGGDVTVFDATDGAFARPAPSLSGERRDLFFAGEALFSALWVVAPSTTTPDGLGPTYSVRSCRECHARGGRGDPATSMIVRIAGAPDYGEQLQPAAIAGVPAEGRLVVTFAEETGAFADGEPYALRRPAYALVDLAFGALPDAATLSPRAPPAVFGLGLLSLVPADSLPADPDDRDGDGIRGRPGAGRFGWKATQPSVSAQIATAFHEDIGITSPLHPDENCPPPQVACQGAPSGGAPELSAAELDLVVFHTMTTAVPARREAGADGEVLFGQLGCAACHVPTLTTGDDPAFPELSRQTIHPYTDLLLHDMGTDLADGFGPLWRTPPLWGLGLHGTVNGNAFFLHDGRARSPTEAILWHGGEAAASRDAFRALSRADRDALVAFLNAL